MNAAGAQPTNFKYAPGLPVVGEVLVASGWAAITFFPDSPGIAVALLALDLIVLTCLVIVARRPEPLAS